MVVVKWCHGDTHTGHPKDYKDTMIDAIPTLKERLKKSDPNILFSVVNDLSKVSGQV